VLVKVSKHVLLQFMYLNFDLIKYNNAVDILKLIYNSYSRKYLNENV